MFGAFCFVLLASSECDATKPSLETGLFAAKKKAAQGSLSTAPAAFMAPIQWVLSAPLISPQRKIAGGCVSVKDPSVVFYGAKWHVFMTIRCLDPDYTPTVYVSFDKWNNAARSPQYLLKVREEYFAAPQVFYFRPHKKWYLIYQVDELRRRLDHHVGYSTTDDIANPASWTKTQLLFLDKDPRIEAGLDFWIICDEEKAYLFYTSLNGKMWRLWTHLGDFPAGFDHPELALQADIFEGSHTYRLKGMNTYLTVVESGQSGRRFYKAYLADRLDGKWTPLADREEKPFAGAINVKPAPGVELWTDNISHGELIRDGYDETMTVDPRHLQFLIQGVLQKNKPNSYGKIPWRIGMLTPAK